MLYVSGEEGDVATLSFLFKVQSDVLPTGTGKLSCQAQFLLMHTSPDTEVVTNTCKAHAFKRFSAQPYYQNLQDQYVFIHYR